MRLFLKTSFLFSLAIQPVFCQTDKDKALESLDKKSQKYWTIAKEMWENPELGYLEYQSSNLLITELKNAGFRIETEVAGIPTAFVATYGKGEPVIGILAEYDALPGMSQKALPKQEFAIERGATTFLELLQLQPGLRSKAG